MKINLVYKRQYDLDEPKLRKEYEEFMGDYELTMDSVVEFIKDRFINPNFDTKGNGFLSVSIDRQFPLDTDEEMD